MNNGEGKTKSLKVSLWDKLGRVFRGPVIGMGAVAGVTALARFVAGPIIASAGATWAPVFATAVNTVVLGGLGLQVLGLLAAPAAVTAIAYGISKARNGKLYNNMKQKALLRKLSKALKRGKDLTLTEEQIKTLQEALQNENKSIQKLINKIGREDIERVIEKGRTGAEVETQPEHEEDLDHDKEKGKGKGKGDELEHEEEHEEEHETERKAEPAPENHEDLYAKISRKNLFTTTLSARESLELQQIYNEQKKNYSKKVSDLEKIENPTPEQQAQLAAAKEAYKKFSLLERRAFTLAKSLVTAEMNDPNKEIPEATQAIYKEFMEKGRRSKTAKNLITDNGRDKASLVEENLDTIVEERKKKSSGR